MSYVKREIKRSWQTYIYMLTIQLSCARQGGRDVTTSPAERGVH